MHLEQIDNRMQNLINKAGFGFVIVENIDINQHLMSALVER